MMWSSDFVVLHPSPLALQVVSPRTWLNGLIMLLPGLPALGSFWVIWRGIGIKSFFGVALGLVLFGICGAFTLMTRPTTSSLVLDRAANAVTIDSAGIFFGHDHYTAPLDQVRYAQIDTGSASAKRIVLILRSGRHFGFTPFTDRRGQEEAVQAINDFLHEARG